LSVSVGIAILRYRLFDIDLIIRRTLIYGVLTVGLALAYWCGVVVLQQVLRPLVQGSDLAIVGSTLAVAALFQPLRHWIQRTVDRRFFRQRYDVSRTLETFSSRMRDELDLDSVGAELLAVVRQTMQPQRLSLWLRTPADRISK
jgi:branched-subunit amino acid ABC-type transport system permease component